MSKTYSQTIKISDYQTDMTTKLAIPMIPRLAIATVIHQSDELGIGMQAMHDKDLGWVILQYDIQIKRRPGYGEEITIKTIPQQCNDFFATRDVIFTDENGEEIITMHSLWATMTISNRRLSKIDPEFSDAFEGEQVKRIEKLLSPEPIENIDKTTNRVVNYFELDSNKHANNGSYFDWFFDPMDKEFMLNHEPTRMVVKYRKEVSFSEKLDINLELKDNVTVHEISVGDANRAAAQVWWEEKK